MFHSMLAYAASIMKPIRFRCLKKRNLLLSQIPHAAHLQFVEDPKHALDTPPKMILNCSTSTCFLWRYFGQMIRRTPEIASQIDLQFASEAAFIMPRISAPNVPCDHRTLDQATMPFLQLCDRWRVSKKKILQWRSCHPDSDEAPSNYNLYNDLMVNDGK